MEPTKKKRRRISPTQEAHAAIQEQLCSPSYLEIRDFGPKGRGIVTRKPLQKGDFVTYYHGQHTDCPPPADDIYFYEVTVNGKEIWIDGSAEDGSFGRLINDSETPNLNPKPIDVEGRRYVAFYATCEISTGEEVAYYYGESEAYWWRKKKEKQAVLKRKIQKEDRVRKAEQSKLDSKDDRLPGSSTNGSSAKVDNALRCMTSEPKADNSGPAVKDTAYGHSSNSGPPAKNVANGLSNTGGPPPKYESDGCSDKEGALAKDRANGRSTKGKPPAKDGMAGHSTKDGTLSKDGADGRSNKDGPPAKDRADGSSTKDGPPAKNGADGPSTKDGPPAKDRVDGCSTKDGPPAKNGADGSSTKDGPPAKNGADGPSTKDGPPAKDRVDGPSTKNGPPAKNGTDGPSTKDGPPAKNGADGRSTIDGTLSKDGPDGPSTKDGPPAKDRVDGCSTKNGPPAKNGADGRSTKDGTLSKDGADDRSTKDGPPAKNGVDGPSTKDGPPAKDRVDGRSTKNGPPAKNGLDGRSIKDGTLSKDGADGRRTKNGPPAKNGPDGRRTKNGPPAKNGPDGPSVKDGPPAKEGADGRSTKDGPPAKNGADDRSTNDGTPAKNGVDGPSTKDGTHTEDGVDGRSNKDGPGVKGAGVDKTGPAAKVDNCILGRPPQNDPEKKDQPCYIEEDQEDQRRTRGTRKRKLKEVKDLYDWEDDISSGGEMVNDRVDGCSTKDGPPAKDGVDGCSTKDGPPAKEGADGRSTKDGPPAMNGADGRSTKDGPPAQDGADGPITKDGPYAKDGADGPSNKDGPGVKGAGVDKTGPAAKVDNCILGRLRQNDPEKNDQPCYIEEDQEDQRRTRGTRKCKLKEVKDLYDWEDDILSGGEMDDDRDEDFVAHAGRDDDDDDDNDDDDDDVSEDIDGEELVCHPTQDLGSGYSMKKQERPIKGKSKCPTRAQKNPYQNSPESLETHPEDNCPTAPPTSDPKIDLSNLYKDVTILSTSNGESKKFYYCLFCEKPQKKLPRHLTTQHKQEPQVIDFDTEKDPKVRSMKLAKLRNMGNHKHNCDVFRNLKGELIVGYRPSGAASAADYGPCESCYIYLVRTDLWKHKCPVRELRPMEETGKRKRPALTSKLLIPTPQGINPFVHQLLLSLNDDEVGRAIRLDCLLVELARREYQSHGHDVDQHNDIRQTLRRMGRLLLELRKQTKLSLDLEAFITPLHFRAVLAAARAVAGFEEGTNKFQKASVALKIGHTLKRLAAIVQSAAIENFNDEMELKALKFNNLCVINWTEEISTNALRTLHENKRNKVKVLPLTEDIVCISNYLKKQGQKYAEDLQNDINTMASWKELNRIILTRIIIFNRRRSGEASKMKLADFTRRSLPSGQKVVLDGLTPIEQELCRSLHRIEIVGKRERAVPVLLTADMVNAIDLLIKKRTAVGVDPNNTFLFPRVHFGSVGHVRGCDCLRDLAEESGCKSPTLLRSTGLRKQIATVSQIVNLKDNELDILATFLGHDIRIHRQYYRLPEDTLEVAKVSKLLLASERGLSDLQGKTLDEIDIGVDEELDAVIADLEKQAEDEDREEATDDQENFAESYHAGDVMQDVNHKAEGREEKRRKKAKGVKVPWSTEEKKAVLKHLGKFIIQRKLPGKKEIDDCLRAEPVLSERPWRNVKDFCRSRSLKKDPLQV